MTTLHPHCLGPQVGNAPSRKDFTLKGPEGEGGLEHSWGRLGLGSLQGLWVSDCTSVETWSPRTD